MPTYWRIFTKHGLAIASVKLNQKKKKEKKKKKKEISTISWHIPFYKNGKNTYMQKLHSLSDLKQGKFLVGWHQHLSDHQLSDRRQYFIKKNPPNHIFLILTLIQPTVSYWIKSPAKKNMDHRLCLFKAIKCVKKRVWAIIWPRPHGLRLNLSLHYIKIV